MGKSLVAYFSATGTGTTADLAGRLAKVAGADLFQIEPAVPYTQADLDWRDASARSTIEMHDPSSRPEVAKTCPNMAEYDTVYVGFPIWWYVAPTIVNTFLEAYDLAGKTIVPFATSGGSGMGKTVAALKPSAPGAVIEEGAVLNGASDARLAKFVEEHR